MRKLRTLKEELEFIDLLVLFHFFLFSLFLGGRVYYSALCTLSKVNRAQSRRKQLNKMLIMPIQKYKVYKQKATWPKASRIGQCLEMACSSNMAKYLSYLNPSMVFKQNRGSSKLAAIVDREGYKRATILEVKKIWVLFPSLTHH